MFEQESSPPASELLVADSFRVRVHPKSGAAEVRGLERHLNRFTWAALDAWCGPHRVGDEEREQHATTRRVLLADHPELADRSHSLLVFTPPIWNDEEQRALTDIEEFLREARAQIADFGEGWPRLELWGAPKNGFNGFDEDPTLRVALRPLPELHHTIELRSTGPIEVEHPARKGPNIERYAALKRELGAEALLTDEGGHLIEGATTSLVWWPSGPEGPEPWGSVVESRNRVPSVTESLIVEAGGNRLVGTKPDRRRIGQPQPRRITLEQLLAPDGLFSHEVWAVNALHGIRVVTSIDGISLPAPEGRRLKWFREALERAWEPVLPGDSSR